MLDGFRTVVRPVVTEKSSAMFGALKEYTFEADPRATKLEIRQAIESLFGVTVTGVRTAQQRSKLRTRGRSKGRRPHSRSLWRDRHRPQPRPRHRRPRHQQRPQQRRPWLWPNPHLPNPRSEGRHHLTSS